MTGSAFKTLRSHSHTVYSVSLKAVLFEDSERFVRAPLRSWILDLGAGVVLGRSRCLPQPGPRPESAQLIRPVHVFMARDPFQVAVWELTAPKQSR